MYVFTSGGMTRKIGYASRIVEFQKGNIWDLRWSREGDRGILLRTPTSFLIVEWELLIVGRIAEMVGATGPLVGSAIAIAMANPIRI